MFNIGQHVRAQWTNGQMYGARIVQSNGTLYEVAWDDGSPPLWLEQQQIQPDDGGRFPADGGAQHAPGQHVMAQWTNGQMYGARIVQFNGSQYEVAWDDGSPPLWLASQQIQSEDGGRPAAAGAGQYAVGQHVLAQWTNGQMYGARIVRFERSLYEVAWDDGSPPLWVAEQQMRPDGAGGGHMAAGASFGGAPFGVGDAVLARWTNGQMYGARIVRSDGGNYEVAWDDGSPSLWVTQADIQRR